MNELQLINENGKIYVDSRQVAEMIGKRHDHLMRSIDGYVEVLGQNPKLGVDNFFVKSSYQAGTGKTYPCYKLTRKGCDMVANKLTGEKGILFTAEYVTRFEQMNASNFRLHFGAITRKIAHYYPCLDMENPYQAIRHEFYERLEAEARCDLDRRLKNKKERALRAGFSKNKIKEINKLDIIQEDTRLINSAIAVLKKMSIQYGIN